MAPNFARLAIAVLALGRIASAQTPAPAESTQETPGLLATQVTLIIDQKDGKGRLFRGTVLARKDDVLTVLTAAHCLSVDDANGPVRLIIDGESIRGKVESVVRNPAFKANPNREIPGADNAVARFRFKPEGKPATEKFGAIKPAVGIASRPYPSPGGQTVSARMIDQKGAEHAVKAGNYSNPRLLEWGPSYKPIPGDSGGGVFVMSAGSKTQAPRPILIGVIVMTDDKGGMASLVSKEIRWVADELAR